MHKRILFAVAVLVAALVGLARPAEKIGGGKAKWGAGTSTITRYIAARATKVYLIVAPDTQNVSVIYYDGATPQDTLLVLAGDALNGPTTDGLWMTHYSIVRLSSTDGIDYGVRADGR